MSPLMLVVLGILVVALPLTAWFLPVVVRPSREPGLSGRPEPARTGA